MPMATPAASNSQTGQWPEASPWLLQAQWLIDMPALASRGISAALK